jgi:Tannase and feruloyl esterase
MKIVAGVVSASLLAVVIAVVMSREPVQASASCESLTALALPGTTITLARTVEAGADTFKASRAFCRVAATLKPSSDSDIKIEVWLPVSGWNGKFQAVGNGAFNGAIGYPAMATALGRGYATASTDTGHEGPGASFALGHPEKAVDFAWRSVHEMTVTSKKIIAAYYDAGPRFSYWNGCSAGGRQSMKEAQRFPADFDGIIAGAPGLDWTGRAAQAVHVAQALEKNEAARLSPAKARLLHGAVLKACDALDGVKDGVVDDPRRCTFDPTELQCKSTEGELCLTAAQVTTAKLLYSTKTNPSTHRAITGLMHGSELGWTDLGWTASARATGLDQFRFLVFKDPHWTIDQFNFNTDIVRAEEADNNTINALDPNLKPFIDRGGKLIQYHGWNDPQISPASSVQYYERVVETLGTSDKVRGSYRLFMAPGMGHCGGGEGPNNFDMVSSLEQWVESGKPPDRIIASHSSSNVVDRSRPLCPYPEVAKYSGTGSTDEAANFACAKP